MLSIRFICRHNNEEIVKHPERVTKIKQNIDGKE